MTKSDFLDHPDLIEESQKITQIAMNYGRSTTGPMTWTNPRTNRTYSVASGGELALAKKIRNDNSEVFGVLDMVPVIDQKVNGSHGTTAARPTLTADDVGYQYFDTTLGAVKYWSGTAWV